MNKIQSNYLTAQLNLAAAYEAVDAYETGWLKAHDYTENGKPVKYVYMLSDDSLFEKASNELCSDCEYLNRLKYKDYCKLKEAQAEDIIISTVLSMLPSEASAVLAHHIKDGTIRENIISIFMQWDGVM